MSAVRAVCFDLDGTLVETEELKATSYAEAAAELRPHDLSAGEVAAAYTDLVGCPREQVLAALMRRFRLEDAARRRMPELGASSPTAAFSALRLRRFEAMLADADLVRRQAYPETIALLRRVKAAGERTGLATMSYAAQVWPVLDVLEIRELLDAVITREEVDRAKPDPEIYLRLAERLAVPAASCLVIEDSLPGVRSALAAGMRCVAATTRLTRDAVRAADVLPPALVVDDPARLAAVVLPLLGGLGGAARATA